MNLHYLCEVCNDTGLQVFECSGDASCGRPRRHLPHSWGKPCHCPKGLKFQPAPKPAAADFTAAGKTRTVRA
jgi:hypothetical protein